MLAIKGILKRNMISVFIVLHNKTKKLKGISEYFLHKKCNLNPTSSNFNSP